MRQFLFSGYSDDTFGVDGSTELDYCNNADGTPIVFRAMNEAAKRCGRSVVDV